MVFPTFLNLSLNFPNTPVLETLNKIKRHPSEWEKIIANKTTENRLIGRIYKRLIQLNIRKTKSLIKNQIQVQNRHFSKYIQMAHTHKKRCSTSLIIRELEIKTSMRYHLTLVRMSIIKMSTINKCWRWCGEKGMLLYCWWEFKLTQPLRKTLC